MLLAIQWPKCARLVLESATGPLLGLYAPVEHLGTSSVMAVPQAEAARARGATFAIFELALCTRTGCPGRCLRSASAEAGENL